MRARIWATAAGAAAIIAGVSGAAFAASGPSPSPSPSPIVKTAAKGSPPPARDFFDDRVIGVLSTQLGVSRATAVSLAAQLRTLSAKGGLSPDDPAFIAIARSAGVTAGQLRDALTVAKKGLEPAANKGDGKTCGAQ